MINNSDSDVPPFPTERTPGDASHAAVKGLLGSIPHLGAGAQEVFIWFVAPPLQRRQTEWWTDFWPRLTRLIETRGISIEQLQANEVFIDSVLKATTIALRTKGGEKREALRNACLNAALPSAPDEAKQAVFLDKLDSFTDWHLRILALFDDPVPWFGAAGIPVPAITGPKVDLKDILFVAYPQLEGESDLYRNIWDDLVRMCWVSPNSLHHAIEAQQALSQRTTYYARQFLAFIREPPADSGSE